ncbi:uncharacterized protein BJ171DRAFT_106951 [Polychytrium aggregatum]|uniref:uncharacterized protein n=1 Tax=Polychytrium aggregatum TaxID=110093 RepID=UPI0022FDB386|nr:uncharacterized protein BJ171DRAFT_106951 [Polychytrium aggregatum]KAI9204454.1 hypothetical protein BJ171DRAFT_106951 [Polychytrium aggregatum]
MLASAPLCRLLIFAPSIRRGNGLFFACQTSGLVLCSYAIYHTPLLLSACPPSWDMPSTTFDHLSLEPSTPGRPRHCIPPFSATPPSLWPNSAARPGASLMFSAQQQAVSPWLDRLAEPVCPQIANRSSPDTPAAMTGAALRASFPPCRPSLPFVSSAAEKGGGRAAPLSLPARVRARPAPVSL